MIYTCQDIGMMIIIYHITITHLIQEKISKDFTARKYIQANGYTAEVLSEIIFILITYDMQSR